MDKSDVGKMGAEAAKTAVAMTKTTKTRAKIVEHWFFFVGLPIY